MATKGKNYMLTSRNMKESAQYGT